MPPVPPLCIPLMTGKPIVAAPIVGIISFETMMLLAILATCLTMIVRVRRALRRSATKDARIDDGLVALSLRLPQEHRSPGTIRGLLEQAGAKDVAGHLSFAVKCGWTRDGQALALSHLCALCDHVRLFAGHARPSLVSVARVPRLHSPAGSVPRQSRSIMAPITKRIGQTPSDGERVYRINCLHCHGPDGYGDGPVAGYLRELPANLRSHRVQDQSETAIYGTITQGKDMMPTFKGELSAEERWAVAGFVKSLH